MKNGVFYRLFAQLLGSFTSKPRFEAFSDGGLVIITIMVLEFNLPHGTDLVALRPAFLRFVYLGI